MSRSTDVQRPSQRGSSLWLVALVLLAAAVLLVMRSGRPVSSPLELGQPLPPLNVAGWLNTDGAPDLRAQVVLVDCWASWCRPCVENMPEVVDFYERYRGQVLVIGLTPEQGAELEQVRAYVESVPGLNWPIAYGAQLPIEMMGVYGLPTYILFDRTGKSVWSGHTFDGLEDAVATTLAKEVESQIAPGSAGG